MERHGVRVRVLGDLSRLPPEVHSAALGVMAATHHHTRGVLNICFAYSCVCRAAVHCCVSPARSVRAHDLSL